MTSGLDAICGVVENSLDNWFSASGTIRGTTVKVPRFCFDCVAPLAVSRLSNAVCVL